MVQIPPYTLLSLRAGLIKSRMKDPRYLTILLFPFLFPFSLLFCFGLCDPTCLGQPINLAEGLASTSFSTKETLTWLIPGKSHIHNHFYSTTLIHIRIHQHLRQPKPKVKKASPLVSTPFEVGNLVPLSLATFLIRATLLAIIWEKSKTIIARLKNT